MKDFYKSLDHYRKLLRENDRPTLIKDSESDKFIWLCDGFTMSRIPVSEMELNPAMFKPFKDEGNLLETVKKASEGQPLKKLPFQQIYHGIVSVPLKGDDFTVWLDRLKLDLFPAAVTYSGTGEIEAIAVKDHDITIGIVLPVRMSQKEKSLFELIS